MAQIECNSKQLIETRFASGRWALNEAHSTDRIGDKVKAHETTPKTTAITITRSLLKSHENLRAS
jgi:hypothetical protein